MKKRILIISLALLTMQVYAQHDEQVTVEGKYRPKVNKVNKIVLNPETPQPSYDYFPSSEVNHKEAKQKFALDVTKIAPMAFASKNDKIVTPTENFLMAGFGTRLSPLFLYKHNSMLTKTLGLGVGVKHNSSWLNIKDYAPSGYMNNAFDVNLTTSKFDGFQLDGGVYYKNDMYHYYGMSLPVDMTEAQIEEACPRQTYNTIGAHVGMASTSTRVGVLNHSGSVDYRYTFDRFDKREHYGDLEYNMDYAQSWWGKKSHPQKLGLNLGFLFDNFTYSDDRPANNRFLLKIKPFFEMSDEFYRLHLGLRLDDAIDEGDHFFSFRPDLSGSLFVFNRKLEFYAGLNGGHDLTSFGELIEENPFLGELNPIAFQNVKLGFEGGIRTNIVEIVDLHMGVRYRYVDHDPLFQQNKRDVTLPIPEGAEIPIWNSYRLVYDETQTVSVLANIRVKLRNSFTADMGFAYNHYKLAREEYAWYRPKAEGKLKLTYDVNERLAFNTTFLYQGGRYAKVWNYAGLDGDAKFPPQYDIKRCDVYDLSVGADYKVNDQITAFALLDNVACQKYQLYYNYPVTGIQFFAGVKLIF